MPRTSLNTAAGLFVRHTPLVAAVLTAVLGAAGLALWHLQASLALNWTATVEAMPHHASTALLLSGLALGAARLGAFRLCCGLAGLTMLLMLNSLAGQTFGYVDLLEAVFAHRYGATAENLPWTMPMANALAFLLAAAALLLAASRRGSGRLRHLGALLSVLSLSAGLPVLGGGGASPSPPAGTESLSLLPALGIGQLLLAAGVLTFAYRRQVRETTSPLGWIATVVVVGQLALTLLLWHGLELLIEERQSRLLTAETTGLGQRFAEALQLRIRALERMARRWEIAGGTRRDIWTADALGYIGDLQGFQALQWADPWGRVRWVVPEHGNESAMNLDNSRDPVRRMMLERANIAGSPIVTGPIDLVQGGRGLLITRALEVDGHRDGYLVAVFRVADFLQPLSEEIASLHFALEVTLGGQTVFSRGTAPQTSRARAQAQDFVINGDAGWQFRIWPSDTATQRGPFSDLFLASGMAMTLLVAVAFWFWSRNAHAARKLKEANQALSTERNFVTGLIDNTNALSIVFDPDGRIVRFNRACEELTGYAADDVLGKRLWDVTTPESEVPRTAESFSRLVARAQHGRFEGSVVARDGRVYQIAWSNSVLRSPDGHPKYVMSVGIDVTERKRAADALIAAKEDADRANRAKSEFLSSMSHELRTPMNAVLGFAQLIAMDPQLASTHRDSVEQILKAGDLLLHLINDILNLSRIESGRIEPALEAVSCRDLVAECVSMVSPLARRNDIRIETGGDAGFVVQADRHFLKQIVLNLLSNAIKYNRRAGHVGVDTSVGPDGALRIAVSDTGLGISPDLQAHLFEPFNRLGAQHGNIEGSGIGLVVCKRLIESMGGSIAVASEPGRGSTFTVTLAGAHCTNASSMLPSPPEERPSPGERVVLHIGPDTPTRRLVQKILSALPNVRVVDTPDAGSAAAAAGGAAVRLVIVDVATPGTDPRALLETLGEHVALRGRPVIALATGGCERQAAAARAAGFSEYLNQPVDVQHFRGVVRQCLDPSPIPESSQPAGSIEAIERKPELIR